MRILVTGGAGFIGSHVVEAYLDEGHQVFVLDDLSRGRRENVPPDATFLKGDVRSPDLADVFATVRPEVVNHHAADLSVAESTEASRGGRSVNVVGTANVVCQAVSHQAGKVIFASSAAVYGAPSRVLHQEKHWPRPRSPYAKSKLAAEGCVHAISWVYGLEATILRYGSVYGPRQTSDGGGGIVATLASQIVDGHVRALQGDTGQEHDLIFVTDVANANVLALQPGTGGLFNLGTGRATTIDALWHTLRDVADCELDRPAGRSRTDVTSNAPLSWKRAAWTLQWRPEVGLREGLRRTMAAFRRDQGTQANERSAGREARKQRG